MTKNTQKTVFYSFDRSSASYNDMVSDILNGHSKKLCLLWIRFVVFLDANVGFDKKRRQRRYYKSTEGTDNECTIRYVVSGVAGTGFCTSLLLSLRRNCLNPLGCRFIQKDILDPLKLSTLHNKIQVGSYNVANSRLVHTM